MLAKPSFSTTGSGALKSQPNSYFVSPVMLTVSFSGGFCYGCGVLDYVEGFAQQFKALSAKVELKVGKTRQINPRNFEADYIVKLK